MAAGAEGLLGHYERDKGKLEEHAECVCEHFGGINDDGVGGSMIDEGKGRRGGEGGVCKQGTRA